MIVQWEEIEQQLYCTNLSDQLQQSQHNNDDTNDTAMFHALLQGNASETQAACLPSNMPVTIDCREHSHLKLPRNGPWRQGGVHTALDKY